MSPGNERGALLRTRKQHAAGSTENYTHRDDTTLAARCKDQPEFGTSRRRFLIAMLMAGAIKPEAVTGRIVAEIEREAGE